MAEEDLPSVMVPVRSVVLVDVTAVMDKVVEPLEPLLGDKVIHDGLLTVSQAKLEVIATL